MNTCSMFPETVPHSYFSSARTVFHVIACSTGYEIISAQEKGTDIPYSHALGGESVIISVHRNNIFIT